MTHPRKANPQAEYRLREIQRVNNSVSLAEKFPKLKSLTGDLACFDTDDLMKSGELRYSVNTGYAKPVSSFVCPSGECVGGDFDLSGTVAQSVTGRRKILARPSRNQSNSLSSIRWRRDRKSVV